ncbi:putative oxidoreductase YhdF [Hypsizygus marmoreus]|uniref:Oxidoreductase YhdF n=1 Tax=Hypsizygus marmoreus TaxID=39966 RepID=A0A369K5X5_HYPMA|nr:putative oxidoreductase YhdF [Hypsizygus marmoreus]
MSKKDVTSAYSASVSDKQNLAGLDKHISPRGWNYGKPSLIENVRSEALRVKTFVITGGDSGIGRVAAVMFVQEGCKGITIIYLPRPTTRFDFDFCGGPRRREEYQSLARGAGVNFVSGDLMEEDDCKTAVKSHQKKFGILNVLVNDASKQIICKNSRKLILGMSKLAFPHLKCCSSIISMTSVTSYNGSAGIADHSSIKGAIVSFR